MNIIIDEWSIDSPAIGGLKFKVTIVHDEDAQPFTRVNGRDVPDECYSAADVKAWRNDEWIFVGTLVTPVYQGILIPDAEASLWGTQWGNRWNTDTRRCVDHVLASDFYNLPGEALANVSGCLDSLIAEHQQNATREDRAAETLAALQGILTDNEATP